MNRVMTFMLGFSCVIIQEYSNPKQHVPIGNNTINHKISQYQIAKSIKNISKYI